MHLKVLRGAREMKNCGSEYRSRGFVPGPSKKLVQILLDQLAEAEEQTDPQRGDASAKGKDQKAFLALRTAGDLVEAVAGWAIDHVCGLSIRGISVMPLQPTKSKRHEEYLASRALVDSHEHERVGGEVERLQGTLTQAQRRVLLRNLLFGGSMAGPDWLRDEAFQAFDALEYGETVPMLTAAKGRSGAKVQYRELCAQLKLIAFARFRAAAGYSNIEQAFDFVADKAGVSRHTLLTWEKRLREQLGLLEVSRTIEFATNAASHVRHATDKKNRGLELTESEAFQCDWHAERYSTKALEATVAEYHKVKIEP